MRNRRAVFGPLIFGPIGFTNVARNPRFDTFHVVDVLQLLVTGVCLGVSLMALVTWRRSGSDR
jgi:hypothetical protein